MIKGDALFDYSLNGFLFAERSRIQEENYQDEASNEEETTATLITTIPTSEDTRIEHVCVDME